MNQTASAFDADYYLRGCETGKSLYLDYRWIPNLTIPMVRTIISHLGIEPGDTVCDFGCARGYTVRAFRELGYAAWGVDCSEWAIENADDTVRQYVRLGTLPHMDYDWILAKDVLEHIPSPQLEITIEAIAACSRKGFFAVVPLAPQKGMPYVVPEYEQDVTHVQRLALTDWGLMFWTHSGGRHVINMEYLIEGIKQNWSQYENGNGFIWGRRHI